MSGTSLPPELPHRLLRADELPGQVDADHLVPLRERHVGERRVALDPGVRDDDVDAAEALARRVEQPDAVFGLAEQLSIVLGVAPSAATADLVASLPRR